MFKLLALDMDGTLLTNQKTITEKVSSSIKDLIERDLGVTIATGRFPASAWLHAQTLGLTYPLVALNGAVVLDAKTGEKIESISLPPKAAGKIADFAKKNNVYVHYHGYNVLYVNEKNDMNKSWAIANIVVDEAKELIEENYQDQLSHFRIEEVGSLSEFVKNEKNPAVYKATVINDNTELVESLYQEISQWPELSVTRTGPKRFDINAANVSKKTALETVCRLKNISSKEVVAVGDYDNDSAMLEWAGLGIAMGNGNELVKKLADVTTFSNEEDGVAHIIEEYFKDMED